MKHERLLTAGISWFLSFITALGAAGCLLSAFQLPLENAHSLLLVSLAAAFLSSALLVFRRGSIVLICLTALACGYLYHDGRAAEQFTRLLYELSTTYDRAYGWGILAFAEDLQHTPGFDWAVGILAAAVAMAVSISICRQKSVWPPVLLSLLCTVPCIVVTDTVPGELYLFALLAGLILLLMTTSVRQENAVQGLQLTLGLLLPVAAALTVLFLAIPQKDYVNQSAHIQESIRAATQKIPSLMESGMNQLASRFQKDPPARVDLAGLGPRLPFTYPVMEVTAQSGGTLYLRGRDYDSYDGTGWTATKKRQEPFSRTDGHAETLTIRTENQKDQLFIPYYPQDEILLTAGRAENTDHSIAYSFARNTLPDNWRQLAYRPASYGNDKWPQYCDLPEQTRLGAQTILDGLFSDNATHTEKADIIAALVTNAAEYHLDPEKMPEDETDFALWFLESGDSGYCVHFATAAAVLLRAADVPARYVTGYMVETIPGQTVTVTEENAHAWAEYYEPNLNCWVPLEVTPGTETEVPVTETQAPETTAPPETEPPTEESVLPEPETVPSEPVSPPTQPEPTAPAEPASLGTLGLRMFLRGLLRLVLAAAVLSLIPLQRVLRLRLRRRQQRTGSTNRQALRRWQETEMLCRLLKAEPPDHLLQLAQKAKFSRHEIAPEELQLFDGFRRTCQKQLREKPWCARWVYKYIFAAY